MRGAGAGRDGRRREKRTMSNHGDRSTSDALTRDPALTLARRIDERARALRDLSETTFGAWPEATSQGPEPVIAPDLRLEIARALGHSQRQVCHALASGL